jgi:hypothetical protein
MSVRFRWACSPNPHETIEPNLQRILFCHSTARSNRGSVIHPRRFCAFANRCCYEANCSLHRLISVDRGECAKAATDIAETALTTT